jgi:hypothetical protein
MNLQSQLKTYLEIKRKCDVDPEVEAKDSLDAGRSDYSPNADRRPIPIAAQLLRRVCERFLIRVNS